MGKRCCRLLNLALVNSQQVWSWPGLCINVWADKIKNNKRLKLLVHEFMPKLEFRKEASFIKKIAGALQFLCTVANGASF